MAALLFYSSKFYFGRVCISFKLHLFCPSVGKKKGFPNQVRKGFLRFGVLAPFDQLRASVGRQKPNVLECTLAYFALPPSVL